ncbi:MAG: hypothetical protein MJ149_00590, partial [Clostridia bacterium]|nr:hypothetical protein [Clostridia bacterium]
ATKSAIAGMVYSAINKTQISGGSAILEIEQKNTTRIKHVGGVVAYFSIENNSGRNSNKVSNVDATVKANQLYVDYFGGVVGYAYHATIENCSASGEFAHINLNGNGRYLGGIVGYARACTISYCVSTLDFQSKLTFTVADHYVGSIAGYLYGISESDKIIVYTDDEISDKKSKIEQASGGAVVTILGLYGNKTTNYVDIIIGA